MAILFQFHRQTRLKHMYALRDTGTAYRGRRGWHDVMLEQTVQNMANVTVLIKQSVEEAVLADKS